MSWFTNIFGSAEVAADTVGKATDAIINGVDKIVYTDEEKDDRAQARWERTFAFIEKTFDENSIRNITRRWLAWGITLWILSMATVAVIFAVRGNKEAVNAIIDVARAFWLGEAFSAVIVAYFGVQWLRARDAN